MKVQDIARLIPAKYRDLLLDENVIYKAIATPGDKHMQMLYIVWTQYVDPNTPQDMTCVYCLADIKRNFEHLQDAMIENRRADQLLDS